MRKKSVLAAALMTAAIGAVAPFASSGCTIQPLEGDAGTTGGGPAPDETVGDQCSAIASAFCTHVIDDCGFTDSLADCLSQETPTCCSVASDCDAISQTSSSALDACTAAIAAQDCATATSDGIVDLEDCQGIPARP
ncbi:MAG TPA: hypothetical protein VGM06_13495 [Polyangiaceae bacterium]|jgi:hypothetical protein